jgi:hypothetical protein
MNELSIPFTIPKLEEIQTELLCAINHDYKKVVGTHAFSYTYDYMAHNCPKFMAWLMPKVKVPIRVFRYYITPPHTSLDAHIDGINPTSPFGINIPIIGTKNTYHCFYETSKDNIYFSTDGYLGHIAVRDSSKLNLINEKIEVLRPYIMNNSVLHGVKNESDEYRVMFNVRWPLHDTLYRKLEDVIDTSDLLLGQ